jgi:hypothetical protein
LYDDLKSDARQVYLDVMDFLGLEDDNRREFPVGNPSQRYKIQWLGKFLLDQPKWLRVSKSWFKRTFGIKQLKIKSFIDKRNVEVGKRKPLPPELVSELKNEFREDVARVALLIERDLDHWCD